MSARACCALLAGLACAGCAAWREQIQATDVAVQRAQRQAEAVQSFETHRDEAQLQAALDRWSQGDTSGCESRLRALLARHPDDARVRLRLGQLLWFRGDAPEAEAELRQVLTAQPELAEAHHVLAMLHAETGRAAEARGHAERAAELDPGSGVYQQTLTALP
jgi:Flp pilus assembly protein TadD